MPFNASPPSCAWKSNNWARSLAAERDIYVRCFDGCNQAPNSGSSPSGRLRGSAEEARPASAGQRLGGGEALTASRPSGSVRGTISNARPYRNTRTLTSLIPARWAGSTPARSITAIFGRASSGSWNVFASIFTLPTCSGNPTNFQSEPPPATFLCNWFWRGGSPARNRRQQIRTRTRYSARMDIGKMLDELRTERAQLDEAILTLQRLAAGQGKRRGRPPAWMTAVKRRGRPPGSRNKPKDA